MDGAGSLRWVDGWQLLNPAQRENIRLLSVKEAMAIARAQRCAYAITGRLVARGDSAEVFLELYDVRGDSVIARPSGKSAGIGESWRGGMHAVTEILPVLISTAVPDVETRWHARPPQAVAHFLLGEAAFRRVQLPTRARGIPEGDREPTRPSGSRRCAARRLPPGITSPARRHR